MRAGNSATDSWSSMLPVAYRAMEGSISRTALLIDCAKDWGGTIFERATTEALELYQISNGLKSAGLVGSFRLKYFPVSTTPTISMGFPVGPVEIRVPSG